MVTERRTLRGLSHLSIFPVTANTEQQYVAGEKISVPGAQSLTSEKEVDKWKIYADDGIYDAGVDWKGHSFTLTLADMPNSLRQYFEGGVYDSVSHSYTFKSNTDAPMIAMSFSSVSGLGKVEMTKVYCARCFKVSLEHRTKGENNSIVPVKIEGEFMERKTDKAVFTKKDGDTTDTSWLDTITE